MLHRPDDPIADRLRVQCACGFVRAVASAADFLDAFEEVSKHLRTAHPGRTAVGITMQVTVTEGGD